MKPDYARGIIKLVNETHEGNLAAAARELGLSRSTLRDRYYRAQQILEGPEPEEEHAPDAYELRRVRDENLQLKSDLKDAQRRANDMEDVRNTVLNLSSEPIKPEHLPPIKWNGSGAPEVPMLFASDWHFGEVISLEEMGGLNKFNTEIATARYNRLIDKCIREMTDWWIGQPPEVFYYLRGGDMIGGEIHEELRETNDMFAIPAVNHLLKCEVAGLQKIRDEVGCEIRVISVPGNHGRTTKKPYAKGFAIDNFDLMGHTLLEWHFQNQDADWITFAAPPSGEALFEVYGHQFLLMHGDRMGTGGGAGFMGAIAPISRGHKKTFDSYASRGILLDVILSGHFHTKCETEYGYGNGCLPGPSEYSNKLKARPRPAGQWFFSVAEIGIARQCYLFVGDSSEGTIYRR